MKRLAVAALLLAAPAYAHPQQQTPMEQSLANKLTQEINASIQCGVQLAQIAKERDELKVKCGDRCEPPKPEPPAKK